MSGTNSDDSVRSWWVIADMAELSLGRVGLGSGLWVEKVGLDGIEAVEERGRSGGEGYTPDGAGRVKLLEPLSDSFDRV